MLQIRNASLNDIPFIRDISFQTWPTAYTPIIGAKQVDYMLGLFYSPESLQTQMQSGHEFLICYHEGKPAAFASYSEVEPELYKLHKLYIVPGLQKKGIGKLLLFHIISDIKARGAKSIRLNVNRQNMPALAFYNRSGFKLFADEDIDIGEGYYMNDFVLSKDISSAK